MWICVLIISMNLYALKEISLFGFHLSASEPLVVGYLLTLNLIQEYYGRSFAKRAVSLTLVAMLCFILLNTLHLAFKGTPDHAIFFPLPRLYIASLISFFSVQWIDIALFARLRQRFGKKKLLLRTTTSLLIAETLDTVIFTGLGMWSFVDHPLEIMLLSISIKCLIIFFQAPFIAFSRRVVHV